VGVIPEENRDLVTTGKIERLWPHHRSMARALVYGGATPDELARTYGFSHAQISKIINSPLFRVEVERLEKGIEAKGVEIWKELHQLSERAVETIDEDLQCLNPGNPVRQRAAFDILNRTGYGTKAPSANIHVGGDLNLRKEVKGMSTEELIDDVMTLVEGDYEEVR